MSLEDDIAGVRPKLVSASTNLQALEDYVTKTGTVVIGGNTVKTLQTSIDEIEEAKSSAGQSMAIELAAAEGHKNTAQAAAGTASTQAGLADTARQAAEQAETAAGMAKSDAETAAGTASTQAGLADSARQAAEQAESDADQAKSDAETAAGTASTQAGLADGARQAAEQAEADAEAAKTAAETAANTATTKAGEAAASAGIAPALAQAVRSGYAVKTRRPAVVIDPVGETYLTPTGPVSFSDLVTFVRNSAAVFTDGNGAITSSPADTPRIDHHVFKDGMFQRAGLRVDTQATNLVLRSEDFTVPPWNHFNVNVTANTGDDPVAGLPGHMLTTPAAGNNGYLRVLSQTVPAGVSVLSAYLKRGSTRFAQIRVQGFDAGTTKAWFDLENGVVGQVDSGILAAGIVPVGANGWHRCWVVFETNTALNGSILFGPSTLDGVLGVGAGDTVGITGVQVETGGVPTSYIKTETSQVTRAGDDLTIPAANMPSLVNGTTIIIEGEADWADTGTEEAWFNWGTSTATGILRARLMNSGTHSGRFKAQFFNTGSALATTDNEVISPGLGVRFCLAVSVSATELTICVNGTATSVSHSLDLPTMADKFLEMLEGFSGTLSKLRIFDTAIPEATLIAETTL